MRVCMLVALVSLTACSKQTSDEGSQDTILTASPMSLLAQRQREAPLFLQAARAAQFSYFAANGVFCGYPRPSKWPSELPPANRSAPWTSNQSVLPEDNAWHHLGIAPTGDVHFQYEMAAGRAGESGGLPGQDASKPWFWVRAVSALDASGIQYIVEVTSDGASSSEVVRLSNGQTMHPNEILK